MFLEPVPVEKLEMLLSNLFEKTKKTQAEPQSATVYGAKLDPSILQLKHFRLTKKKMWCGKTNMKLKKV